MRNRNIVPAPYKISQIYFKPVRASLRFKWHENLIYAGVERATSYISGVIIEQNMEHEKSIWTIGHSTHPIEVFVSMLISFDIQHVIDIRRFPGSKRFPQYNKPDLDSSLSSLDIKYTHLEALGGRRTPMPDSVNTAWRVKGFRGYADYMDTEAFKHAINQLEKIALVERSAFMCTEAVWWSCHRSLVSDYLKAYGWIVMHIMSKGKVQEHPFTKAATVIDGILHYDIPPQNLSNPTSRSNKLF